MTTDTLPYDLFLSYSRDDAEAMQRLLADLTAAGLRVWHDPNQQRRGTPDWNHTIQQAITASRALVVLCSPHSHDSIWVDEEVESARSLAKPIIGVLIGGTPHEALPTNYPTLPYFDFRDMDDYPTELPRLIAALTGDLAASPPPSDTPAPLPRVTNAEAVAAMEWLERLGSGQSPTLPDPPPTMSRPPLAPVRRWLAPFSRRLKVIPRLQVIWIPLLIMARAGASGAMPSADRAGLQDMVPLMVGAWGSGMVLDFIATRTRYREWLPLAISVLMGGLAYVAALMVYMAAPLPALAAGIYVLAFGLSMLFTFYRDAPDAPCANSSVFVLLLASYGFLVWVGFGGGFEALR